MILEDAYCAGNPAHAGSPLMTVLSGCSGGGKSSLLSELARRGYAVMPEAGREIVKEQRHIGGDAVPWIDAARFADLNISRMMGTFNRARPSGPRPIVFDRSLIDAAAHIALSGQALPASLERALRLYRYGPQVFLVPPWRAIFTTDAERRKPFSDAVSEYDAALGLYRTLGYTVVEIPKMPVAERADFFEATWRADAG